jgi:hypothetical protein
MTCAEELRQAAARLLCSHVHSVQPPHGSLAKPGNCKHCGAVWGRQSQVDGPVAEPLAAWLEAAAAMFTADERHECGLPIGDAVQPCTCPDVMWALAVARAINGGAR